MRNNCARNDTFYRESSEESSYIFLEIFDNVPATRNLQKFDSKEHLFLRVDLLENDTERPSKDSMNSGTMIHSPRRKIVHRFVLFKQIRSYLFLKNPSRDLFTVLRTQNDNGETVVTKPTISKGVSSFLFRNLNTRK